MFYDKLKVAVRIELPLSEVLYELFRPEQNRPGRCTDCTFLDLLGGEQPNLEGICWMERRGGCERRKRMMVQTRV